MFSFNKYENIKTVISTHKTNFKPYLLHKDQVKLVKAGDHLRFATYYEQAKIERWHKLDKTKLNDYELYRLKQKFSDGNLKNVRMKHDYNLDHYIFKKFTKVNKTRAQNIKSISQTVDRLKDIINANVTDYNKNKCLFITLTYKKNMTDTKQLYLDTDKFIKKMRYYCKTNFGVERQFEYINTVEPQERGAWHAHIIFIFKRATYIENKKTAKMWGHGFTKTQKINHVENVGNYLASYLTNLWDENGEKNKKARRLSYYPRGLRIYRTSRGIVKPIVEILNPEQANKYALKNNYAPISTRACVLQIDKYLSVNGKEKKEPETTTRQFNYIYYRRINAINKTKRINALKGKVLNGLTVYKIDPNYMPPPKEIKKPIITVENKPQTIQQKMFE